MVWEGDLLLDAVREIEMTRERNNSLVVSQSFSGHSHSVVSNSLESHEPQHIRLPCPSLSPRVCSNSCPLRWWCHWTISSSVTPFSSCPQSFPASRFFQWVGSLHQVAKVIGVSALASVLPMNIQGWFSLGLTSFIFLLSKGLSKVFSNITIWILQYSAFFMVQLSHMYMTTGKIIALPIQVFILGKVMSLLLNTLWKWKSYSCVPLFVIPWIVESMEFSRPEYWSR